MKELKKIGKFAIPAALAVLPLLTFAVTVPGVVTPPGTELTLDKIKALIETIANFMIIAGVVVAVIFIVYGGLKYMLARGNQEKAKEAKDSILHGVIGAAVILGVGVILNTTAALVTRTFFGAGQ